MTTEEHGNQWEPIVIDSVEVTPLDAPHGAILTAHLSAPVPERWPQYLRDALGDLSLPFHSISLDEISVPVESEDEYAVRYARLQVDGAIGLANERYESLEIGSLQSPHATEEDAATDYGERRAKLKDIQDKINTEDIGSVPPEEC